MGSRVEVLRFRVWGRGFTGAGFRVQGSGFRVQGIRRRLHGSGFKVQGFGVWG